MRKLYLSPDDEFLTYTLARIYVMVGMGPGEDDFENFPTSTTHMPNINSALRDAVETGIVTLRDGQSLRPLPVGFLENYSDLLLYPARVPASHVEPVMSRTDFQQFCKSLGVDSQIRDNKIVDVPNAIGYTVRGAARALAQKYAISARAMRDSIVGAIKQGKLRVRNPRTGMPCTPNSGFIEIDYRVATAGPCRISITDLNEWLGSSGVQYELEVEPDDHTDTPSSASVGPVGIDRNKVMRAFAVKSPALKNERFWDERLGRPPNWLIAARVSRGKPGVSSRWDPLLVAHALLGIEHMTLNALDVTIRQSFPESFEQWREQTADFRS